MATTPEIIEKVILEDRRMKVRKMANTQEISKEGVCYILHEEMHI